MEPGPVDIAIIGAGAAGLAAAIFAAQSAPGRRIVVLDGAAKPGAKILVAGGGRCNVTNAKVTPADYCGGSRNAIKRVLAALPVERTIEWFREMGVTLHEEENGKLFPDSNQARTVLDALLAELQRSGAVLLPEHRVTDVVPKVDLAGKDSRKSRPREGIPAEAEGDRLREGISAEAEGDRPREGISAEAQRGLWPQSRDTATRGHGDAARERNPLVRESFPAPTNAGIASRETGFLVSTSAGAIQASRVVLATGGMSLPQTGSDGGGYELARRLGHSIVPTTPGLVPLVLEGTFHVDLSGISQDVELCVASPGGKPVRLTGSLLWTHFGISGPVVLNASRHWHRARLEGRPVSLTANLLAGRDLDRAERELLDLATRQPRTILRNALGESLPSRVADAVLAVLQIDGRVPLAHLSRDVRRRLLQTLIAWPLPVRDSRGYHHAEITAGGVPLDEVDTSTMQSRTCPGLFLAGEILDVDGRIGGFNFQWAWASGCVAGQAIGRT